MDARPTKIPSQIAEVHSELGKELYYLYTKWNYWKRLYCRDNNTVELLHYAAGFFFVICREVFRDDMILTVTRLTDPAFSNVRGSRRENATFGYLVSLLPEADGSQYKAAATLKVLASHVEGFRKHRNRRIGHSDLATRKKRSDALLPSLSLEAMDTALEHMARLLNTVESHYDGTTQLYETGIYGEGNAEDLVDFVRREQKLDEYFNTKEFGDLSSENES